MTYDAHQLQELKSHRLFATGPIINDIHLVDLYMYDSSLFASAMVLEDSDYTLIIDTGTSNSVGALINYLHFNEINLKKVYILPTHHHFDHTGGILPLLEHLSQDNHSKIKVLLTKDILEKINHSEEHQKMAEKSFGHDLVGNLGLIPDKYVQIINIDCKISLGKDWDLSILQTPGHCSDHISPILKNKHDDMKVCYLGEAMGINLTKECAPIPASSDIEFNSIQYVNSIKKIMQEAPDIAVFSHFGGISGRQLIRKTGERAIKFYLHFKHEIEDLYGNDSSTRSITKYIFNEYSNKISTLALNRELARNLAFTSVYGILKDLRLK